MFKNDEQVVTFIDLLEKFTLAVIDNRSPNSDIQDAVTLNKQRLNLELFVKLACGIAPLSETTAILCPDCGAEMKLRTNKTNGNKFYGCVKFPQCRGTRDEDGLSKADRDIKKYNEENRPQEGGFSFNRPKRDVVNEVAPPLEPAKTGWINPFAK